MSERESIHAMCEEPTKTTTGLPLSCMRSSGHLDPTPEEPGRRLHRDWSEMYEWTDTTTPVEMP